MSTNIRRAAVAGSWYPDDPRQLRAELEQHLSRAQDSRPAEAAGTGRLVGLVSPHAGLHYSGPVAAHGYSLVRGRAPGTVVLVGPSHRVPFDGVSVVARGAFATPLGDVPIDEDLAAELIRSGTVVRDGAGPHREEHSLEMQLPFLVHLLPGFRIVPLLMGSQTREEVDALAEVLARALPSRDVLLVASSDLSHYLPATAAQRMDAVVIERIRAFDPEGLMDRLETEPAHACGGGAIVTVMKVARSLGAARASILCYADSGDEAPRDKSRVVGYVSAALTAEG